MPVIKTNYDRHQESTHLGHRTSLSRFVLLLINKNKANTRHAHTELAYLLACFVRALKALSLHLKHVLPASCCSFGRR
jgi:hypothetical protein